VIEEQEESEKEIGLKGKKTLDHDFTQLATGRNAHHDPIVPSSS